MHLRYTTDVGLDQSTLCSLAELQGGSFLMQSHNSRIQLADTDCPSRPTRKRAQFQVLKYGERRPRKNFPCTSLILSVHAACSYSNWDNSWLVSQGPCPVVWWYFYLPIKLLKRSKACGKSEESWALYGKRRRQVPTNRYGRVLTAAQVFMESATDVHELLAQYAEEIRTSVGRQN